MKDKKVHEIRPTESQNLTSLHMLVSPHHQFSPIFQATSWKDREHLIQAEFFFPPTKRSNSHFSCVNSAAEFSFAASVDCSVSPRSITVNKGGKPTHNHEISELFHKLPVTHAAPRPVGTSLHQCDSTSFSHAVFIPISQSGLKSAMSEAVTSIQLHQHLQGFTLSKPHLISICVSYWE